MAAINVRLDLFACGDGPVHAEISYPLYCNGIPVRRSVRSWHSVAALSSSSWREGYWNSDVIADFRARMASRKTGEAWTRVPGPERC